MQLTHPWERGFSRRCVERFCNDQGILKLGPPLSDDQLDTVVAASVSIVGPMYGRKMMKDLLARRSCSREKVCFFDEESESYFS